MEELIQEQPWGSGHLWDDGPSAYILEALMILALTADAAELAKRAGRLMRSLKSSYLKEVLYDAHLSPYEPSWAIAAGYALGLRGDPASLGALPLCFTRGYSRRCAQIDVFRNAAIQAVRALARTHPPSSSVDYGLGGQAGLRPVPIDGLVDLTKALTVTGDSRALRVIVAAYVTHPEAQNQEKLRDFARTLPPDLESWIPELARQEPTPATKLLIRNLLKAVREQQLQPESRSATRETVAKGTSMKAASQGRGP